MIINNWILGSNPFLDAYLHSDWLGKIIFLSLLLLSVVTWVLLIYKIRITSQAKTAARQFQQAFEEQRDTPLALQCHDTGVIHPFQSLYATLRQQTVEILNKNRQFSQAKKGQPVTACLSPSDIDLVGSHVVASISKQIKGLESQLYLLSTIVSLGPFLGLLGTVWGILTTFSDMQTQVGGGGGAHQMVLGGLSLALATTVLGLIDAIPALVGYNYLKNTIRDFEVEMESFSSRVLASVELQYRQVDIT
jgi:biopolymer transport protein TolQ